MKHNVSMYDTGRVNSYTRRNEGWLLATYFISGLVGFVAFMMVAIGLFDPTAPIGISYLGLVMLAPLLANGLMFLTHRNIGLNVEAVKVMDAIYSLPKEDRKRYKISKGELNLVGSWDSSEIVNEIRTYTRSRSGNTGLGLMLGEISEYNKTVKMIEGDS